MVKPLTVYSASAGSGKTFTLTAYYIAQLMKDPDPDGFKHLLAVTFTVKATGEMKDRILGTLYNLASIRRNRLAESDLDGEMRSCLKAIAQIELGREYTWPEVQEVSEKAALRLSRILRNYDRFRVTTIDSFFQSVLKGVARELGLPANLRTEISDEEVRRLAVDRLMESLSANEQLSRQVWSFVQERIDDDQRWSVSSALGDFSQWLFREEFGRHRQRLDRTLSDHPDCLVLLRKALEQMRKEAQVAVAKSAQAVVDFIATHQLEQEEPYHTKTGCRLDAILKRCRAMMEFEAEEEVPKTLQKYQDDPSKLAKHPLASEVMHLLASAEEVYAKRLFDYNSALLAQENLHQLGLINAISRIVAQINEEKDQFILADTGALLADLMGCGGNSDFIFDKIGPSLEHIMIDEFQDTSRQQWTNFRPLFDELLADHRECLIVGDVKQSLYRWRNGDWKVLAGVADDFPGRTTTRPLSENYRSERTIVDFNNELFTRLSQRMGEQIAHVYGDVRQELPAFRQGRNDQGLVRVRIYNNAQEKAGAYDDMRQQILRLHEQGVPYGDMAILVRFNRYTPAIIDTFRDDDLRLVSGDAFMLQSSWAVRVLVAALRYLLNKDDSVARAFCSLLAERGVCFELEKLREWRTLPLQELNERLMGELHLGDYADQTEYLTAYMDGVASYVQGNPADIGSFLEHWDSKMCRTTIYTTDSDAIRIVTFHASKGLAFEHVFIPDCDFPLSKFYQDDTQWVLTQGKGSPYETLPVLPIDFHKSKRVSASCFAEEMREEVSLQLMDAINLVYVAFTRAKKSLYVWGRRNKEYSESSRIATLIDSVLGEMTHPVEGVYLFGSQERTFAAREAEKAKSRIEPLFSHPIPCRMAQGGYVPSYRQSSDALKLIGDTSNELGDIIAEGSQMHDVLAYVLVADDLEQAIARYRSEALLSEKAEADLRRFFAQGLKRPEVSDWFSGRYRVMNEQTIVVPTPIEELDTLMPRPDRVMVGDDKVVVVDYKFTRFASIRQRPSQHEKYQRQVRAYMQVLGQLYPGKSVEGYLWFLKDNQIEPITQN